MPSSTPSPRFRAAGAIGAIVLTALALPACTTTLPESHPTASNARESSNAQVDAALSKLYNTVPGSRELVGRSAGVLVFPSVVGTSLVVGAEHGRGELRVGNRTQGYYSTTAASIGWQAGAQSKAVIYVFTTSEALAKFRSSNGWTVGADATVAVAHIGANGSIDTTSFSKPVVGFVLTNVGLEAGVSLQGATITPVTP
ncbi:BPSL1445 family SYLF domain-containing lipoprotein [Xylophilus sp.]|uniref:BPSL1445 family SYLF domain-containing lipoprotein n=1 Tax=Xylophilus sp. TaxID=2653893 RepID=UPI0013BBA8F8|nr:YSC84-related protein [Xylophilus sp.]KAF1047526.1 MAG: hypothetical protein GAK38_01877 [Xylophilus sp.]